MTIPTWTDEGGPMPNDLEALLLTADGRLSFGARRPGFLHVPTQVATDPASWPGLLRRLSCRRILAEHVLCHMDGPLALEFLKACRSALAGGGELIIGEPDAANPSEAYQTHLSRFALRTRLDVGSAEALLREAGFAEIEPIEYFTAERVLVRGAPGGPASLVSRSSVNDARFAGPMRFTSLVVAARTKTGSNDGPPDYYGHRRSMRDGVVADASGAPIPWFTYAAIEFLRQIDLSDRRVFEYGGGASTAFWAGRARRVVTVEHDPVWCATLRSRLPSNAVLIEAVGEPYVAAVATEAPHDVIVIDGRWRYDCATRATEHLAPGGLVILDNAERYPAITALLRERGLLQVDMIGPGPVNAYHWATSLFFSREFDAPPNGRVRPAEAPGLLDAFALHPEYAAANQPGGYL